MIDDDLPASLRSLRSAATAVASSVLAPESEAVDRDGQWPEHAFRALAEAGLMGLHVPKRLGGQDQGLLALALVTEELGAACPSSSMCYGMHCVATKVIAVKATPEQEEAYLRPISAGRHITTLSLSEPGSGANFYIPETTCRPTENGYVLNGLKSFITNGGHADSYVVSAVTPGAELDPGRFSCFIVDSGTPSLEWLECWSGLGMRGNSSRGLRVSDAAIPKCNLLGHEGDEIWYVFDVIAPYFLVAMSGTYLGIARSALDLALAHMRGRRHSHTGQTLGDLPALTNEVSEMWISVTRARQLLHHAAQLGDAGSEKARTALFACKADIAEMAVAVTDRAMALSGGRAYGANSRMGQLLRDARAAHIMAPTTHQVKQWLGRSLLGLPML